MVLTDDELAKLSCCERCSVRWRKFKKAVWNKETGEFCGKSKVDWGKTFVAYTLFYGVFAAFYAACFAILARTLGTEAPSLISMMSPIKNNPALNFEPKIYKSTTFIRISNSSNSANAKKLQSFYEAYKNSSVPGFRNCSIESPSNRNKPCDFDPSLFGESCSPENEFGLAEFKPCVMLRINKVFGWNPVDQIIDGHDCDDKTLSNRCVFHRIASRLKTELKEGYIPISCQGQNDGDSDNLFNVTFTPKFGIPSYFFPFLNQDGFQSPAVMAQFEVNVGVAVMIWCRLWTENIKHDLNDQQGSVRFELLVDGPMNYKTNVSKLTSS